MKTTLPPIILASGVFLLVALCLWPLVGHPWILSNYTDIDLSSGDFRHQVHVCAIPIRTEIKESRLAREVRRLGIDVPATRIWKHAFESHLANGSHTDYLYGRVVVTCNQLLSILDEIKAPDGERRAALETLMASLRTGEPRDTQEQLYLLIDEIGDKHGLDVFVPEFKEYLRALRKERQAQTVVP